MATGLVTWSKTAATNASADSAVNFSEGQAPSSVNDSARGLMASAAKWRDDTNGSLVTAGGTTAYTLTTNQSFAALAAGLQVAFQMNATNTGTSTLAVDGLTAKPLRSSAGVEVLAGALLINATYKATYFTSNSGEWLIESYPVLGDGQIAAAKLASNSVTTAKITDANVTLAKMESRTANTLIGRYTASTGVPQEVTVSTGLSLNTSTGVLTAPAFPPTALFKKLSILVASNTTVTVAADFVVTSDGTNYQATAVSSTINLGTTGADALDTGTIAIDTWYAIWVVAKSDGTTKCVASTSASSPTMPSGYTYKARVGWVKTIHGSATLYGTYQFGRRAQYVVGVAQTSTAVTIGTTSGTSYTSITVIGGNVQQSYAPSTASVVFCSIYNSNSTATVAIAPNVSYGGATSTTNSPPIAGLPTSNGAYASGSIALETTTIQAIASAGTGNVFCNGWEDNI